MLIHLIQCGVSTGLGLEQGTKGEEVSVESLVWATVLVLSLVPGGQIHEGRSLRLAAARSPPIGRDLDPPAPMMKVLEAPPHLLVLELGLHLTETVCLLRLIAGDAGQEV